jgi:hypothetical protein
MPGNRASASAISIVFGLVTLAALFNVDWDPTLKILVYTMLVVFFMVLLISSQQYEEDSLSKIERMAGALVLPYLFFIGLLYLPIRGFIFGQLITGQFFLSDFLALMLFMLFFFLFGTAFLTLNSMARFGFLSNWRIFNNPTAFFVSRSLFIPALVIFFLIQIRIYLP